MEDNNLVHHGIKGQRWGVRRTPAQLGYSKSTKPKVKLSLLKKNNSSEKSKKVASEKPKKTMSKKEIEAKKKEIVGKRSARDLYKNKDLFTYDELMDAYKLLSVENNIKKLVPDDKTDIERYIDSTIKWGTKIADLTNTGTKVYTNTTTLYKTISQEKK